MPGKVPLKSSDSFNTVKSCISKAMGNVTHMSPT